MRKVLLFGLMPFFIVSACNTKTYLIQNNGKKKIVKVKNLPKTSKLGSYQKIILEDNTKNDYVFIGNYCYNCDSVLIK